MDEDLNDLTEDQRRALALVHMSEADTAAPELNETKETPQKSAEREGVLRLTIIGLVWVFSQAARRGGDHWKINPAEAEELGSAMLDTVYHYWPDLDFGPGVRLLVVAGAIIAPRVAQTRKMVQQAADSAEEGAE